MLHDVRLTNSCNFVTRLGGTLSEVMLYYRAHDDRHAPVRAHNSGIEFMKKFALIALFGALSFPAMAQSPTVRGDETKQMTNCPPSKPHDAQPIEESAILPDAEGEESSAAPTTQRQGETVVASQNCGQPKK